MKMFVSLLVRGEAQTSDLGSPVLPPSRLAGRGEIVLIGCSNIYLLALIRRQQGTAIFVQSHRSRREVRVVRSVR